ncbi:MAG: DUF420 domain-containing protein [Myxococcales bacterium]|nr:DUF420 domain-containing protein [Myxococcales bacterium]
MSTAARPGDRDFFGKPMNWLVLAIALCFVPVFGYMIQSGMSWDEIHPALNAMINASCFVFLIAGRRSIARGREMLHKQCMMAALATSGIFLVSYVTRYMLSGTHRYAGEGWDRTLYLVILFSHMLLAMALVPQVLRSVYLGIKGQREKHRRLVKWAWPIWAYVSATGVVVYIMLYRL